MFTENKKGKTDTVRLILGGIFLALIVAFVFATFFNYSKSGGVIEAASASMEDILAFFTRVLYPLFEVLLGLNVVGQNNVFLVILSFILISIIVVGTLDSVEIFGSDSEAGLINFAIGIIVSIIGVRFMPPNLWDSLAAPSSAFVATVLVGMPFLALFFVTMKLKSPMARKLFWIFYIVFLSYLIILPVKGGSGTRDFLGVYVAFLTLSLIMLIFGSKILGFFYKEKEKAALEDLLGNLDIKKRHKIREEIIQWQAILNDTNASAGDKANASKKLSDLKGQYGQDLARI